MATSISLKPQQSVSALPPAEAPRPPSGARKRWIILVLGVALLAAAIFAVIWLVRSRSAARPAAATTVAYTAAARGPFLRSVRAGGIVAAVRFSAVAAPALRGQNQGQLTIVTLAEAGSKVKKGDVLAEFDRQSQRNNYEDHQANYVSITDQIAKRRAELDIEKEQRKTELQKAVSDLESARLENRRNEVISRIDAEKNQQALKEAEATLAMLRQTQKLRDEAADAELKLLEIQRERERLQMEYARINYERMIVRSPIDGMVVLMNVWKGGNMGPVQEGDQVGPGMPFLQVVDASTMVVRSRVSQLDAGVLRPGGLAGIHLDAYPDLVFPGKIESVATLAQSTGFAGKVKTFQVTLSVQGSDTRLIPDISASADILIDETPDALLVPRGAVVRQAGSRDSGFVWVKTGDQAQARPVKLGERSDTHWAIAGGLKEGELVATLPPPGALASLGRSAAPEQRGSTPTAPSTERKARGTQPAPRANQAQATSGE